MNTKLIKLLASACISLCLIIAGEWLYANYSQHRLLTSTNSVKRQGYKTDELPEIALTKQPEESYVDLVARPLFIKGRRPVNEPRPETEQAAAQSDSFDWQLTGIYSTKKIVSALFSRSKSKVAKDNYRKITVGDDLDGWKLIEINKDRIMLKQGSNIKELLLRKSKAKTLPSAANSAAPAQPTPFSVPPATPTAIPAPFSAPPVSIPAPFSAPVPDPAAGATEDTSEDNQ